MGNNASTKNSAMAKGQAVPEELSKASQVASKLVREGVLLALVASCAYLTLALFTYADSDPGWSKTGSGAPIANAAGPAGAWIADIFLSLFGLLSYAFPVLLAHQVWLQLKGRHEWKLDWLVFLIRSVGLILLVVTACGITVVKSGSTHAELPFSAGGMTGLHTAQAIQSSFGYVGGLVLLTATFLFGLTIFLEISWFAVMDAIGAKTLSFWEFLQLKLQKWKQRSSERKQAKASVEKRREAIVQEKKEAKVRKAPKISKPKKEPTLGTRIVAEKQQNLFDDAPAEGELPAISLLEAANHADKKGYSEESLEAMSRLLELKLKDFGVIVEVVGVLPGPVVTRFELQPAPGVKASRITNLSSDLARSLAVSAVRVVEVIQGKSVVGIESPLPRTLLHPLAGKADRVFPVLPS